MNHRSKSILWAFVFLAGLFASGQTANSGIRIGSVNFDANNLVTIPAAPRPLREMPSLIS